MIRDTKGKLIDEEKAGIIDPHIHEQQHGIDVPVGRISLILQRSFKIGITLKMCMVDLINKTKYI